MKIYLKSDDLRFAYLKEWLSKKHSIVNDIENAECIILDFKESSIPKNIKNDTLVISYKPMQIENNYSLIDSEAFLKKNAYLTALATIKQLDTINKKIIIYGNGRIASYLHQFLKDCIILARHPKGDQKDINSKDYIDADIIINTIPAKLPIDYNLLKENVRIVDLASFPYGFDHTLLKELGIDIELYSSLPGKFYPKEAGYILYEEVMRCLKV